MLVGGHAGYNGVATDLFAVGVILFRMVVSVPPFKMAHPERDPYYKMIASN